MKSFVYVSHHEIGVPIDCVVLSLECHVCIGNISESKNCKYMHFIVSDSSKGGYYKKVLGLIDS